MQDNSFNLEEVDQLPSSTTFPEVPRDPKPEKSIPTIHWTQTTTWNGNKFATKPDSGMLAPGGRKILRQKSIVVQRKTVGKETYWVTYDESYVVEWIASEVLRSFSRLPYNELQKLISKAMQSMKSRKDNGFLPSERYKGRDID